MTIAALRYQLKRPFHFFKTGLRRGLLGELQFGHPAKKLKIITITGTDGKTTTSTMLYHVLQSAGKKVALLSTVAAYIGDQEIDTGFHVTSPDPWLVQQFLRQVVDAGYEYVVMEVTSHGAYQYRAWGIDPMVAGVTNIDHEHLDYHLNYQNYVEAKALILQKAQKVWINQDDESHYRLKQLLKKHKTDSYSSSDRLASGVSQAIKDRFPEAYNQMNARLCYRLAQEVGVTSDEFITAIKTFPGVPGRMEWVKTNKKFRVVIDFAHTPQGLESALTALRSELRKQNKPGRLIAVYGAAGLRDPNKRPAMGKIGTTIADLVVLTAEDPRTENVWSIIRQMKENLTENHDKVASIADRKQAIEFALTKLAKPGDIVGIFGKGHEKSMCYGTTEYPWSDRLAVEEILKS